MKNQPWSETDMPPCPVHVYEAECKDVREDAQRTNKDRMSCMRIESIWGYATGCL